MKTFLRHGHILRILLTITAMVSIKQADAGDFMLVVSSKNNTIYAGSMAKQLADLYSLPLKGVVGPEAVDYDATEKMVYWTQYDGTVGKLSRAHLNGSNQMTVLDDRIRHAFGLALDVEAGLVYWTDESLGQVGRVRMDGTGTKETIIENLDRPRGIAIDHSRGYIYWTDVGNNPRIERANLDGTNRTTLIDDNLVWPKAVIIEGSNLFWCDGYLDKIERTDLSGSNRSILINLARYKPVHPHDLAIYKDYLYWSDQVKEGVVRVHLNGRGEQRFGQQLIKGIRRIHIQLEPDFCESSPCLSGGTCEDVVNGFVCHCAPGFYGVTCSENPCSSSPCLNGGTCSISSDAFACQCPAPFEGQTCALDPCSNSPCVNGGTCSISSDGFTCKCLATFKGQTCAQEEESTSVVPIVAGVGGAVVVLLIIVIVVLKRRKKPHARGSY